MKYQQSSTKSIHNPSNIIKKTSEKSTSRAQAGRLGEPETVSTSMDLENSDPPKKRRRLDAEAVWLWMDVWTLSIYDIYGWFIYIHVDAYINDEQQ